MEPVIVVVKEIKNGKIMLTEDELKTIVRRAYSDGYWEGRKNNWYCGTYYNSTNPYITTTNGTSSNPNKYADITITCDKQNIDGQLNLDLGDYINNLVGDFMND